MQGTAAHANARRYHRATKPTDDPAPGPRLAELPTELAGDAALDLTEPATLALPDRETSGPAAASPPARPFRYSVLSLLAKGGMAEVLVAKDLDLRRRVALKRMGPELREHAGLVSRFVREVQVTAQLDHPNVVPVYGLEVTPDGALAYAMKLVEGRTFKDLIDEARTAASEGREDEALSLPARLEHFLKVCDAVAYAHGKSVLHRDLKPLNLMVGRYNEVYVMDWGLARLVGGAETADDAVDAPLETGSRTRLGSALGTPAYMSPEQASGKNDELDARSDQYALGLILHELVTLERAVPGATGAEILANARRGETRAPAGGVAPELAAIVAKATATAKDERYPSVAALALDLRRHLRGEAVAARPDGLFQRAARAMARHRTRALAAMLVVVTASALVVALLAVRAERAVERAQVRERRLASLLANCAQRAERIESHFLSLEAYLTGLATAVSEALARPGDGGEAELYTLDDLTHGHAPPDMRPSRSHHGEVSPGFPVFALAPGTARASVLPQMRKLAALQSYRKRVFFESLLSVRETPSGREVEPWDEDEVPLLWSLVGLESGLASVYPGTAKLYDPYDPRTRPWYTAAADAPGVVVGPPFVDEKSGEIVLSMSRRITAPDGSRAGVASIELTFGYVAKHLLDRPEPMIEETFLLDAKGDVLARTSRPPRPPGRGAVVLEPFPVADARGWLAARQGGTRETAWNGRDVVIGAYPLAQLGWTFVAVADAKRLFGR